METINNKESLEKVKILLDQMQGDFGYLEVTIVPRKKTRTNQQRKSLEVYCREMAIGLNSAGWDQKHWYDYIKKMGIETPFTEGSFKEIFKTYSGALFPEYADKEGKCSTTKLDTKQLTEAYELVNLRMSINFGVGMNWPEKPNAR